MAASAVLLAILGLAATFAPDEVLRSLGHATGGVLPLIVQLLGALYLGFAILNWSAKDSLIGGIYNRPVALGNFLHFVAGALALGKGLSRGVMTPEVAVLAAVYAAFAVLFGIVMFTSPVK